MWKVKTEKGLHFSTVLFFESFLESIVKLWMNKQHMRWSTEHRWLFSFSSLIAFGFERLLQERKKERQQGEKGRSPVEIANNTVLNFIIFMHPFTWKSISIEQFWAHIYVLSRAVYCISWREDDTIRVQYNVVLWSRTAQNSTQSKRFMLWTINYPAKLYTKDNLFSIIRFCW